MRHALMTICLITGLMPSTFGQDAGWATLKGRILCSADVPEPAVLDIERDAAVCGKSGLVDESLVVNRKNRGIRYVAIWIESKTPVPVHPDLSVPADKPPVLDNRDCRFEPRMLSLRTNQKLLLTNADPIAHNAAVYFRRNTPFSEILPQGKPLEKSFPKPETLPVRVDCSIHAWMKAWVILQDHPYVAVTDEDGRFELKNLPAGEWKFRFWHERPGYLQKLTVNDQPAPLQKGAWVMTLAAGSVVETGDLIADAEQFAAKK